MMEIIEQYTPDERECVHDVICRDIHELYVAKNGDYGSAFSRLWAEVGFLAGYTKLADKFYRIQSLRQKDEMRGAVDETMEDTLLDLAGYCILCVQEMRLEAITLQEEERARIQQEWDAADEAGEDIGGDSPLLTTAGEMCKGCEDAPDLCNACGANPKTAFEGDA